MTSGGGVDEGVVGTTIGVTTALDELKSRGSALLVVGAVPESIYARLSARMLGEGADRRRLVVEQQPSPESRLAAIDRWRPEWTRIFRCRIAPKRSAAAGSDDGGTPPTVGRDSSPGPTSTDGPSGDGEYGRVAETIDGSITELGAAVGDAIERFDDVADGLDPAELRVAFDCLVPVLSAYPRETVFRFLHLLANQIRSVDGMGHVRLSRPMDSEAVRLFAPLFDAVVELRVDGTDAVHRWHFRDADLVSEWLPVAPTD